MSVEEDWVKAAMANDSVVVDLLIRLNQATTTPNNSFPLEWSVRQRRSKPVTLLQQQQPPNKHTARASPTTPLSWSGATSQSGGAVDGFEDSSPPLPNRWSSISRSKDTGTGERATTKRSKKKKTLSELKDEESSILKERRHLKRELATLNTNMEKQRAKNEHLKRIKLDLQSTPRAKRATMSEQSQQNKTATDAIPPPPLITASDIDMLPNPSPLLDEKEPKDAVTKVFLPDLNLPLEEDRTLYEMMS